jgi:AcrR family transcriptional regulator
MALQFSQVKVRKQLVTTGSRTRNRNGKAEQARATRVKIITAATNLFLRDGFLTTTMAAIAGEAGVAVQTLYLSFGSKTAILQAAFDVALKGDDEPEGLLDRDWFHQVVTNEDGAAALRLFCSAAREVVGRSAPLFEVMRAASADPEVAEVLVYNRSLRLSSFRTIVGVLTSREGFNAELSVEDALTVIYAVISEDSYLLMVIERGWSADRWQSWSTETCLSQLFPAMPQARRTTSRKEI